MFIFVKPNSQKILNEIGFKKIIKVKIQRKIEDYI